MKDELDEDVEVFDDVGRDVRFDVIIDPETDACDRELANDLKNFHPLAMKNSSKSIYFVISNHVLNK